MSLVVDASAVAEFLRGAPRGRGVTEVLRDEDLIAPELMTTEVIATFRGLVAGGHVSEERALGALEDLQDLPVTLMPTHRLVTEVWALRNNLTAYDATYVALARRLGCRLVTCDGRSARALGQPLDVIVVEA